MVAPSRELLRELYRDKLAMVRRSTPAQRFLDGPRIFDTACELSKAGIRAQNPGLDEDGVMRVLRERLALARRLENRP